jgi:hypothetical protein
MNEARVTSSWDRPTGDREPGLPSYLWEGGGRRRGAPGDGRFWQGPGGRRLKALGGRKAVSLVRRSQGAAGAAGRRGRWAGAQRERRSGPRPLRFREGDIVTWRRSWPRRSSLERPIPTRAWLSRDTRRAACGTRTERTAKDEERASLKAAKRCDYVTRKGICYSTWCSLARRSLLVLVVVLVFPALLSVTHGRRRSCAGRGHHGDARVTHRERSRIGTLARRDTKDRKSNGGKVPLFQSRVKLK